MKPPSRLFRRALAHTTDRWGVGVRSHKRMNRAADVLPREVGELTGAERDRNVLLLVSRQRLHRLAPWLDYFSRDHVTVLSDGEMGERRAGSRAAVTLQVAWSKGEISHKAAEVGALDMVVVVPEGDHLPADVASHAELWSLLFLHLREGGWYVIDPDGDQDELALDYFHGLLDAVAPQGLVNSRSPQELQREIREATDALRVSRNMIATRKRLTHYYKVSHAAANELLPLREPRMRLSVMQTRPKGVLRSRAVLNSGGASEVPGFAESLPYPDLHLRKYEGRIGFCGATLLYTGHTVLPDSFRWHQESNLSNFRLSGKIPEFGRINPELRPTRSLSGPFYQLDMGFVGHFGHLMTEVVSRLWGWDHAKSEIPELKALFYTKPSNYAKPQLELDFFTAYGIAEDDLVWVKRPVWLDTVVSATPMWHNADPFYVHPEIDLVWKRLTRGLLAGTSPGEGPRRIFVSRRADLPRRPCRNAHEVEAYFESRGFQIVFPEDLSLADQARLFAGAHVVAGFGGSGMFNIMHARQLKSLIVLSHEAYDARNEYLFAAILGCDVHYVWSSPDRSPRPQEGRDVKAVRSSWEFDFTRNRSRLDDIVDSL